MASTAPPQTPEMPPLSFKYRATALTILMLVMTCAWADRTIIGTIGEAIKVDLGLTDAQLGLLHGLAFSGAFVLFCLPLARLGERRARTGVIACCVAVWSLFTTLSGFAANFLQLILLRSGVGAAESGVGPSAYSLISDYFPAEKRASALSIYNLGVPFGTLVGAVVGGFVTFHYGWRAAFLFLGIPGFILGVIVWLTVREVPRGYADILSGRAVHRAEAPSIPQTAKRLFGMASARHLLAGLVIQTFVTHGAGAFNAPFFIRAFGLNYAEVGMVIGLAGGVASAIGTFSGGFLADGMAAKRGRQWYALIPGIAMAVACPFYLIAYHQGSWQLAFAFITVGWMAQYVFFSPMYAATYTLVEPRMRATTNAIMVLLTNIIALLAGSFLVGLLIDNFATRSFAEAGLGAYQTMCPGGVAAADAVMAVKTACASALDGATRMGLTIAALGYAWASVHFFLAARTIVRDFDKPFEGVAAK